MTAPAYFVTGTDTEIGKTYASCVLLQRACQDGLRAVAMKPVAAGCDAAGNNEDVLQLAAAGNLAAPAALCNPYLFRAAIAPHIAAAEEGVRIEFPRIAAALATLRQQADLVIVEGVGGFRVPLGEDGDSADLAVHLGLPVILVVGMRLGCINHALLTAEALQQRGLRLAGWIANRIDPAMQRFPENLATLQAQLPAPLLGVLTHRDDRRVDLAAAELRLPVAV